MEVRFVEKPEAGRFCHYPRNREPLAENALLRLPLSSVRPGGWLKHQLELMACGMAGRLDEISSFLSNANGWLNGPSEGWEEQAYWFRGFYALAVLTGDARLMAKAGIWIEAVFSSQDADGYFGPTGLKRIVGANGRVVTDLWPHMIMIDALLLHYEFTQDSRVVPLLTRFFCFCRDLPDGNFVTGYDDGFGDWKPFVQYDRAGEMLTHIFWVYNQTGQEWLLELAKRFYRNTAPPVDEWLNRHVVNFTQRFRYYGVYYLLTREWWYIEASEYWYGQHMSTWGQMPGGIFASDELLRSGCTDPRQGFETCAMTEFAKSFYILGRITGSAMYADRCESVMLNHFPASHTPDLKSLHYLTAANQPKLDDSLNHEYNNKGRQIIYSPNEIYRCCQHNAAMGWPWYASNLWQATPDGGLAAWLFAPSEITAKVGADGNQVTIEEETGYPFDGEVSFMIRCTESVEFPLYIRIPGWVRDVTVCIGGDDTGMKPEGGYLLVRKTFMDGERISVRFGMPVQVKRWPRNGSVSVSRGPLFFSLDIKETWSRCGGSDEWPEWEVLPASPWNIGLCMYGDQPDREPQVRVESEIPAQPWTRASAPVRIQIKGKHIPGWGLENETAEELKVSPVRSDEPEEDISLIPLGCARLRISAFPAVQDDPRAPLWEDAPTARLKV